jgi:hypothetical protein
MTSIYRSRNRYECLGEDYGKPIKRVTKPVTLEEPIKTNTLQIFECRDIHSDDDTSEFNDDTLEFNDDTLESNHLCDMMSNKHAIKDLKKYFEQNYSKISYENLTLNMILDTHDNIAEKYNYMTSDHSCNCCDEWASGAVCHILNIEQKYCWSCTGMYCPCCGDCCFD